MYSISLPKMPKTVKYSEMYRKNVVEAINDGLSKAEVARRFKVSKQLVGYWVKIFEQRGSLETSLRQGRPRKTTRRDDVMICRMSKRNPRLTGPAITVNFNSTTSIKVHCLTVKRCLRETGLIGRRPSRKPNIFPKNLKAQLEFAKKYIGWISKDWSKVLWSDESKFNLFSSDGIQYIRRPKNVRYMVPTVKHGGGNVMVWGCFSRDMIGPLIQVNGIMDGVSYVDIVARHMLSHAKPKIPRSWVFQQDNDPKHRSKFAKQFF